MYDVIDYVTTKSVNLEFQQRNSSLYIGHSTLTVQSSAFNLNLKLFVKIVKFSKCVRYYKYVYACTTFGIPKLLRITANIKGICSQKYSTLKRSVQGFLGPHSSTKYFMEAASNSNPT